MLRGNRPNRGKLGEPGRGRRLPLAASLFAAFISLAGCATNPQRSNVENNLLNQRAGVGHHKEIVERYLVACPDVLQIHIHSRSEFNGVVVIGPDGTISLGDYGKVRVEGLPLSNVAQAIATQVGVRSSDVQVRIAEFASRHLVLVGEVIGKHRTIPYQGEETVLDVLQRVGGITPGAEPTEIYVVRSHLADLQRPEVFHVDLQAIVLKKDDRTNVRIRPYDEIYVGETRQARIEKCVPPWVRPAYQSVWNMLPTGKTPQESQHSVSDWIRGWLNVGDWAGGNNSTTNPIAGTATGLGKTDD